MNFSVDLVFVLFMFKIVTVEINPQQNGKC